MTAPTEQTLFEQLEHAWNHNLIDFHDRMKVIAAEHDKRLADAERALEVQNIFDNTSVKIAHDNLDRITALEQQLAAAKAKIDSLILEYCPEEMTPDQIAEWEKHQVAAPQQEQSE